MPKSSAEEINSVIEQTKKQIPIGSTWQHYRGGLYKVISIGILEATLEPCVIYESINTPIGGPWIRTTSAWSEIIEKDGINKPRFTMKA